MSEKDTISMQLVREALLQSCAPGAATDEVLHKVGIDPAGLQQGTARVHAEELIVQAPRQQAPEPCIGTGRYLSLIHI